MKPKAKPTPNPDRVDIPAPYRVAIQRLSMQQRQAAAELDALQRQVEDCKQRGASVVGQLEGLLSGMALGLGLPEDARFEIAADFTHLIRK